MVTDDQPFLFHVIGDVSEFKKVIGDSGYVEDYFLVIVINCSYIISPTTDDDGYDRLIPRVINLFSCVCQPGSMLTCILSVS